MAQCQINFTTFVCNIFSQFLNELFKDHILVFPARWFT